LLDVSKDVDEMNAGHDEPSSSEKRVEKSKYVAKSSSTRSLDDDDVYLRTRRRTSGVEAALGAGIKREESISHWVEDDYIPQKLHSMISGLSSDSLISDNDSPIADVIDPTLFRGYSSDGDTRYSEDILKRVIRNHNNKSINKSNDQRNISDIDNDNIDIHALRRMTSSIEEFEKMEKWLDEQQRSDDISALNTNPVTPSSSNTDNPTTDIPALTNSDTTDGSARSWASDPVAFTPMTPVVDKLTSIESPVDATQFFTSTHDGSNETPIYSTYFSNLYEYTTENTENDSSKKRFHSENYAERPAHTTSEPSSTLPDTLGSSYTSGDNSSTSTSNPPVYSSYFSNLYDYNTGIEDSELTNKIDDSVVNNPNKYEAE